MNKEKIGCWLMSLLFIAFLVACACLICAIVVVVGRETLEFIEH